MHKVYAVDLLAIEDELEKLKEERREFEAKPAIIRRLKPGRIAELDKAIGRLEMKAMSAKEHVLADATSTAIYEAGLADRREKKKAMKASKDVEDQPDP